MKKQSSSVISQLTKFTVWGHYYLNFILLKERKATHSLESMGSASKFFSADCSVHFDVSPLCKHYTSLRATFLCRQKAHNMTTH